MKFSNNLFFICPKFKLFDMEENHDLVKNSEAAPEDPTKGTQLEEIKEEREETEEERKLKAVKEKIGKF